MKDSTSKVLLINFIMYCVLRVAGVTAFKMEGTFSLFSTFEAICVAVICCFMYYSYDRHIKNVMKPLLGAALMMNLYVELDLAAHFIENADVYLKQYPNYTMTLIMIISVVMSFIFMLLLNIIHYAINLTHHSSPVKIRMNRVFFILYIVSLVIQSVSSIFLGSYTALTAIHICLLSASRAFPIASIIAIESSLDEFRIAREKKL